MIKEFSRYDLPDLKGKRVLITGGLGFIGSNLVKACVEQGALVTIYDSLDARAGGNWQNVREIKDRVEIVVDDIRNYEGIRAVVKGQDMLWQCAAHTSHSNSMQDPRFDVDVNCRGVMNVLEAVRHENPKIKSVYLGTSTQIGIMEGDSIDETHVEFPLDVYSANKSVGEKYNLIYHTAYGLKTSVVRLVNIFGPRAHIATTNTCFINFFVGLALQKKNISIFGEGQQQRSLLYVGDAVAALMKAGANEQSAGQVYFACGDKQYSIVEIAQAIVDEMGGGLETVPWPADRQAIEPGNAIVRHDRISRDLGWQPRIGLAEGLKLTREYFEDRIADYIEIIQKAAVKS